MPGSKRQNSMFGKTKGYVQKGNPFPVTSCGRRRNLGSPLKQNEDKKENQQEEEKEEKWESYYPLTEEQKKDTRSEFDKINDKHREIGLEKGGTDKPPSDFYEIIEKEDE